MPPIEPGQPAAPFSLPDQTGTVHTLAEYAGRAVVLYFYMKDDTADCTTQACDFTRARSAFAKLGGAGGSGGVVVLGVSPDSVESRAKFAAKHGIRVSLLADVPFEGGNARVCDAYGVWIQKNMYGRKYMGVRRTTYLIDGRGIVVERWDGVGVEGHAKEVLAAARAMVQTVDRAAGDSARAGPNSGAASGVSKSKRSSTRNAAGVGLPGPTPAAGRTGRRVGRATSQTTSQRSGRGSTTRRSAQTTTRRTKGKRAAR